MNTNTNTNSNTNSDSNSNSANSTPVKCTHGCPTNIGRPEQSIVSQKPNKNYLPPL